MGRKKKKQIKPWCWYCNREFDDEKILIQHQKSKHFKCTFCHKKLYTGPGLSIHSIQVHKEKIDKIPYALPHRCNVDLEIYGMEGIPDEDIKEHERNKCGKEDEIEEKRVKVDYAPVLPAFPLPGMSMTPTLPFMPSISLPVIPPLQFGLTPPMFVTRPTIHGMFPPTMSRINHMLAPPMPPPNHPIPPSIMFNHINQIDISEHNNIPPPPPPVTAIPPTVAASKPVTHTDDTVVPNTPTFPAYFCNKDSPKEVSKVTKPTSSTANVKVVLVHPEDDLPLEQIRLRLAKYSAFLNGNGLAKDISWTKSGQQLLLRPSHNDCNSIPPPPSTSSDNSYMFHQFERPTLSMPWAAPRIIQFPGQPNSGGRGF